MSYSASRCSQSAESCSHQLHQRGQACQAHQSTAYGQFFRSVSSHQIRNGRNRSYSHIPPPIRPSPRILRRVELSPRRGLQPDLPRHTHKRGSPLGSLSAEGPRTIGEGETYRHVALPRHTGTKMGVLATQSGRIRIRGEDRAPRFHLMLIFEYYSRIDFRGPQVFPSLE